VRHVTWFRGAVDRFRFFNLAIHPFEGSYRRSWRGRGGGDHQIYWARLSTELRVFTRVADGKIAFIREYFDPVRAAKAMDLPIAV
jgi:uncharacterized protein